MMHANDAKKIKMVIYQAFLTNIVYYYKQHRTERLAVKLIYSLPIHIPLHYIFKGLYFV